MNEKTRHGFALCRSAVLAACLLWMALPARAQQLRQATSYRTTERTGKNEEEPETKKRPEAKPPESPTTTPLTALDRLIDRSTYVLGPGDRIAVGLWGTTNQLFSIQVTPEGDLLVPGVGPVRVAQLTLSDAEKRVLAKAQNAYRHTRLTLSLVGLRTFRVHVSGLVEKPGSYLATPADRVSTVLERAGGLVDSASTRRIRLERARKDTVLVDLAMFRATGETATDPPLEMGDVIVVPVRRDSVAVWGAVGLPGNYEYRPGDSVSDLLRLAGGLADGAQLKGVEWSTFPDDSGAAVTRVVDLASVLGTPLDYALRPGDRLLIREASDWRRRQSVTVQGEVRFPGVYAIVEGRTRLSDVVTRAGGFTPDAAPTVSRIIRRRLRERPDREFERLAAMQREAMKAGEYAYFKARVRQMRGLVAVNFKNALDSPGGPADVPLVNGDLIVVARHRTTVEIMGQVNRPGLVAHRPGGTVHYYLEQAGGLAWNAQKRGIRVIRAKTGVWIKPDENTILEPGDTLFVPDREPRDWWYYFRQGLTVVSQIATTIFVIRSIITGR